MLIFLRGADTWRFLLPRGDSYSVSCHVVILRGESINPNFVGENLNEIFSRVNPEVVYFARE
jgi:hypothetical protein